MQHLNYCRSLLKQYYSVGLVDQKYLAEAARSLEICEYASKHSVKFMLPDGGLAFEDLSFRLLDETIPLKLPYPIIALEFANKIDLVRLKEIRSSGLKPISKYIIFGVEGEESIAVQIANWYQDDNRWEIEPVFFAPKTGYLSREGKSISGKFYGENDVLTENIKRSSFEAYVFLSFLNVIQCSNVHEKISRPKNYGKKIKTALPFDSYHVLTISKHEKSPHSAGSISTARSPREHLRRGHIRRISGDRKIWINSAIVNAGIGAKVSKDYSIAQSLDSHAGAV